MKAIIHIGMPKTGSTSIQAWLSKNRAALEAAGVYSQKRGGMRNGARWNALNHAIYYVAQDELGVDEKMAWASQLERKPHREANYFEHYRMLTRQFEELSKMPGKFIFSGEFVFRYNKIQMMALDLYLSRYFEERTYVIYLRETVNFFLSMYGQKIQNNSHSEVEGATLEYSEFLNRCANGLVPYGLESSFGNLFDWKEVLGDKLNVRLLEPDWLVNGDLIEDFASFSGTPTISKPERLNQSIAAEYIEYVRMLNLEHKRTLPLRTRWKALNFLRVASCGKQKLAASDAEAESILEIHRDQEERIRKRFFPERPNLYSRKNRGQGTWPVPLTSRRKSEIESEIRKKIAPVEWPPHNLAD